MHYFVALVGMFLIIGSLLLMTTSEGALAEHSSDRFWKTDYLIGGVTGLCAGGGLLILALFGIMG